MPSQRGYPVIIIRRAFLATTVVTLLLFYYVTENDNGEWRKQQQPARQDASVTSSSSSPQQICKSLFTINSVSRNHGLREAGISRNSSSSEDEWRVFSDSAVTTFRGEESSVAAARVRHLLRRRESMAGASTGDYYSLASLLPKLLSFGDDESGENHADDEGVNQGRWEAVESKEKPPFFRGRSRVGASSGELPYIPCSLTSYDHSDNFTSCVRRRLEWKPRLWLCLMGDSKIRYLLYELLARTDAEFRYSIYLLGRVMSWPDVQKNITQFVWTDMEAVSRTEPRMRITFRFRRFCERRKILLNSTQELVELQKWASGAEPILPDLLVVGYTSWMMQRNDLWSDEDNHYPSDILDFLLQMHKAVVPLLEKIGQRTRVLVLPQSRLRPHSYSTPNLRAAFSHSFFEWSEMTFLHLLRRHRGAAEQSPNPTVVPEPQDSGGRGRAPRDHLVPTRSSSGVWWWDSSLPLNLAGILECEELHRRGLASHSAFKSYLLHCPNSQHAGSITNDDLVTMLFNLICNTYLGLDESNCCS